MESLGYILSNKFIVVAADTNFVFTASQLTFNANNIKKAYRLNDQLLISVIGEFHKITDIYTYILKLNELGHNKSFDETVENLGSAFGLSPNIDIDGIKSLVELTPEFMDANGVVNTTAFLEHLASNPDLQALLKDTFDLHLSGLNVPTSVLLFGFDNESIRMGKYLVVGNHLKSLEIQPIPKDNIFIGFSSSTIKSEETDKLEEELIKELQPLMINEWENSPEITKDLINAGKKKLEKGLKTLTPFKKEPNIVFYELSADTKFKFQEPSIDLKKINFKRPEN
jgi:hypothetical protein